MSKMKRKTKISLLLFFILISTAICLLICITGKLTDPCTEIIDKEVVEQALNNMKSMLTDKDYNIMLTISKDWEENTDGEEYIGELNHNLKVENGKMAATYLSDCGFKQPMSMIMHHNDNDVIYKDEIGVKFVGGHIIPNTENPYHEEAEYGICYIYNDDPYKYVDDENHKAVIPYFAEKINYLEKVYDDLYLYVIYSDPLA